MPRGLPKSFEQIGDTREREKKQDPKNKQTNETNKQTKKKMYMFRVRSLLLCLRLSCGGGLK